jgi:hypothetical protein
MLKITQQAQKPEIVRVSLSGHLTSEYLPEVEKALVQSEQCRSKGAKRPSDCGKLFDNCREGTKRQVGRENL